MNILSLFSGKFDLRAMFTVLRDKKSGICMSDGMFVTTSSQVELPLSLFTFLFPHCSNSVEQYRAGNLLFHSSLQFFFFLFKILVIHLLLSVVALLSISLFSFLCCHFSATFIPSTSFLYSFVFCLTVVFYFLLYLFSP